MRDKTFTTSEFRITRTRLLRTAMTANRSAWLWVTLSLIAVAGVMLSLLLDWRFALVTAMLLLVLVPGVMAILYLNYALSPRCLPEAWPHTVTFGIDGFSVDATVPPLPDYEDMPQERETASVTPPAKHIGFKARYAEVSDVKAGVDGLVIRLAGNPPGLVHVPYVALPDSRENVPYILNKCRGERCTDRPAR